MTAALAVVVGGLGLSAASAALWGASARRSEKQAFSAASSNVTATLDTMLRRDADFVSTLRSVLEMEPQLSPSRFDSWYRRLQGAQRQVGGIGSAVVASVPAPQLRSFEARRNHDPAFRALLGHWLAPVVADRTRGRYCLLAAGGAIVPLDALTAPMVQENWCASASLVGSTQAAVLQTATDSGQTLVVPIDVSWLHTAFLETAYYRVGRPLHTVAQRRAGLAGWLLSSFAMPTIIRAAVGANRGLSVALYHTNPGQSPALVEVSGGRAGSQLPLERRTALPIEGSWTVVVKGSPVTRGPSAGVQEGLVFAGGSLISVLLGLLVLTLARSRSRALVMVAERTQELRYQALHDALTGLPNRVLAFDRARLMLARGRRYELAVAALYVDIDGFKTVNDTYGHAIGDEVLRVIAQRLRSVTRESDTAARLSGDEFLVLLDGSTLLTGPQPVAERVREVIRQPIDFTARLGRMLIVTASIGAAYGSPATAEELIHSADIALYNAKAQGKDRFASHQTGTHMAPASEPRVPQP